MKYKLKELDEKIQEYIFKSYDQGKSLDDISIELNISKNTLLSLFYKKNKGYYRDECPSFDIKGEKILTIADTHLGSEYENEVYIDQALETGIKEGVSACLHLGDLIQGNIYRYDKPMDYQLKMVDKCFPKISEFPIYLLLGNHEFIAIENYPYVKDYLEEKFNVVGYKNAYFDWNGYMFAMSHQVKQLDDPVASEEMAVMLMGHGHEARVKSETKLKAGPLCDQLMSCKAFSSFMINNVNDNVFNTDVYGFVDNKAKLKTRDFFCKELGEYHKVRW